MILITSMISMTLAYYYMDTGLAMGFILALFMEIISLIALYNMLRKSELRSEKKYKKIIASYEQKEEEYKKYIANLKGDASFSDLKSEDVNEEEAVSSSMAPETTEE